ncbi:MAG: DUF4403 family protein [Chitinispirillales bacterium]|jgi:hypothetical protein|nr:DUF4403 family protein [Chitinispirillales bacterium]
MNCLIIFLACAALNCASRSKAIAGGPNIPAASLSPVPSTINIPIEIKTAFLEKLINDEFSGAFFKSDTALPGGILNIKISARKNGPVKIGAKGDELSCSFPVKITMRVSATLSALGLSHTEHQDIEAGITFRLRSKISLKNNWLVATTTYTDGYTWTKEPVIKTRVATIPIKPLADYLAGKQLDAIGPHIDKALANSDIIKKSVIAPLWEQLYTPIGLPIPETRETIWMRFDPTEIYLSNLKGRGASISALVGIRAVTEAVIGDEPKRREPMPLPNFLTPQGQDSTFAVNLYAEVPYGKATAICKELFIGKTFRSGMQSVTVNDIEVAGINENGLILLRMELSGSLKGSVRVTGRAVYDERAKALLIENLNYDFETASSFQKTKHWLLKGIIINKMKPHMRFPLTDMLDAEALSHSIFADYPLQSGIALNGRIDSLTVRGAEMTPNAFRAAVLAKGVAWVTVKN